ncbi:MAG: hypothetical protein U0791_00625 [Gemmataceae bacterium]
MADANPPAPEPPPPADDNAAPWERGAKKFEGKVPGGPATGWHDHRGKERIRKPQIAMAVALFFGLAGGILALFMFLEPKPKDVVFHGLPVQEYGNIEWASNPSAQRDAEALLKHFIQSDGLGSAAQQGDKFRDQIKDLDALRGEKKSDLPFVLFVSAMSVVRDGKVFILPGDARLDGPDPASTWIPLEAILKAMDACAAKDKALLLDVARTPADPFRGPLQDDVATQVDLEITAFNPKYPVLASCSPGERSLVIPELRLSAFAAYLAEGLSGEADGYRAGEATDNRITFAEVADFAICRVSQWSFGVPDRRQVPKRYGPDGNDFRLFYNRTRKGPPAEDAPPPPEPPPYPAELLDGWKQRDSHRTLGRYLAPDLVMELESRMLRAEARYLDGLDFEDPRQNSTWKSAVALLQSRTTLWREVKASSIYERRVGRPAPKPELTLALDRWIRLRYPPLDDAGKPIPVPAGELDKHELELEKMLDGDQVLDGFFYFWQKLVDDPSLTAERIGRIAELLERTPFRKLKNDSGNDLVTNEWLLLKRVAKAKLPSTVTPDALRALLQAEQAFGEVLVATGGPLPEGFRRVRPRFEQADRRRLAAEETLFKPTPSAAEVSEAVQQLRQSASELRIVAKNAESIRIARRTVADAAWQLQATLPSAIAWDQPKLESWQRVATVATDLAAQLAVDGPFDTTTFAKLDSIARQLQADLPTLTLHTPGELKKLQETAHLQPEASTYIRLQVLLAGAGLESGDRAAIASGFRKVSNIRFQNERAKFEKEHITKPVLSEQKKWEPAIERSRRRAVASLNLLRFSGAEAADVATTLQSAGADASRWQSLTDKNLAAWRSRIPAADAVQKSPQTLERILRAAPPRLDASVREIGLGNLFVSEEVERRNWLAGRFGEYGKLRSGVAGAAAFYSDLAQDCDRPLAKGGR